MTPFRERTPTPAAHLHAVVIGPREVSTQPKRR